MWKDSLKFNPTLNYNAYKRHEDNTILLINVLEEPKRVLKRRNSELVHLRELLIDVEEDVNTESNLRELVYEVKFSIEDEFEEAKIEKPIGDLKKYIEHVIKENVNSTPDEKDEDNNTEET